MPRGRLRQLLRCHERGSSGIRLFGHCTCRGGWHSMSPSESDAPCVSPSVVRLMTIGGARVSPHRSPTLYLSPFIPPRLLARPTVLLRAAIVAAPPHEAEFFNNERL
eukprot:EC799037.1.p1 GENE.EC799037.1~~EC799037.1.p1  ORF type:complete len:107 (+),score=1.53 EC799037.1:178-498(+)